MVALCCEEMLARAVYRPFTRVPVPLSDQVTLWFVLPLTVAENCCCPPPSKEELDGETEMETETLAPERLMVALADLVASATLVAVTVTVGVPEMAAGAV